MRIKGIAALAAAMVLATGCTAQNVGQPDTGTAGTTTSRTTVTSSSTTSSTTSRTGNAQTAGAESSAEAQTVVNPATTGPGSDRPAARRQSLAAYLRQARGVDGKLRVAERLVLAAAGTGVPSLDARTRTAIEAVDLHEVRAALPPKGLSDQVLTPALNLYGGLSARKQILVRFRNSVNDLDAASGPRNYAEARGCLPKIRELADRFARDLAAMDRVARSHPALQAADLRSEAGLELAAQFHLTSLFDACRRSCGGRVLGNPWKVVVGRMPTSTRAGTMLSGPTTIGVAWDGDHWEFEMNGC